VVFSADGKRLAAAGSGVTIWDVSSGKQLHALPTRQAPGRAVALSPDGKLVAAGDTRTRADGCIRIWEVESGDFVRLITGVEGVLTALAFTPDGQSLVSASRHSALQVWEVATGKEKLMRSQAFTHALLPLPGLPGGDQVLVMAGDGKTAFSTGRHDSLIREWDLAGGELRREVAGPRMGVGGLALSPDGKWLAAGGLDGSVYLHDLATGQVAQWGDRHTGAVFGLAFSADGQLLDSACTGNRLNTWDWKTGGMKRRQQVDFHDAHCLFLGLPDLIGAIATRAVDRDRRTHPRLGLFNMGSREEVVQRWDRSSGEALQDRREPNDGFFGLAPAADGKSFQVISAVSHPALVSMMTGYQLQQPQRPAGSLPGGMKSFIQSNALWEREYRLLVRAFEDDNVVDARQALRQADRRRQMTWAVAAPDGRSWSHWTDGRRIFLHEAGTGAALATVTADKLLYSRGLLLRDVLAFSADARWLAVPLPEGEVGIFDVATGQQRLIWKTGQAAVTSLAFTPDRAALASGGLDGTIRLWDMAALRPKPIELTPEELAQCWQLLQGEDASAARVAMWKVIDNGARSVDYVCQSLLPLKPPAAERVDQLIADLDRDDFNRREKAAEELERLGFAVEDRLRQELKKRPALEVRQRLEAILRRITPSGKLSAEERRALHGVAVLEHIGGDKARQHLKELAAGVAGAIPTEEAKRALERR
jgi:WD40 repeat protein